uniref:Fibrillin-1-like isoform X2 n=1 Tax=Crassostrea virginica TaxID=6565 RepID=A0A8B8D810_CRAVI|nr:fibrillin-1-like isoform X2 [Crassostrea virginica]
MPGYRKVDGVCRDINECQEGTSGCPQQCDNTEGAFICSCFPGFKLNHDNKTCEQTEPDRCTKFNLTCEYTCENSSDGFKCICKNGYELASNGTNCTDINECRQRGVCAQVCDNSIGSFVCRCFQGYTLNDDKVTCSGCIPPNYGDNCSQVCDCGPGVDRCDPVSGCVCLSGWMGDRCDQDVNECTENPAICGTDKICQNLQGSHRCDCRSGFEKIGEDCKDIDECVNAGLHSCPVSSTCDNTVGNYTCHCMEGYKQKSAYDCEDIDECLSGVAGCSQGCVNREGGFNCECEFGYTLNDDRKTCAVVTDICSLYPSLNCSFGCLQDPQDKTIGHCFCGVGFHLNALDKSSCVDVNECGNASLNLCTFTDSCLNTVGSYNCSCPIGYLLENDGRTCSECDAHHYGLGCKKPCDCGAGALTCDKVLGCKCEKGWAGVKCDADIDECAIGNNCTQANQVCQNIPGSYRCICETGYNETTPNNCTDIDECQLHHPCDQMCTNTEGGYTCSCHPGFKLLSRTRCDDIDECASPKPPCDQLCSNSEGGYHCSCRDGFFLNMTTKTTCYAKIVCTNLTCDQHCAVRSDHTEYCFCDTGFYLNLDDNTTCNDTNECLSNPCSDNCTENSPGQGYQCSCEPGKKLDVDLRTCIECDNGHYGTDCSTACSCHPGNTESCDKVTGKCNCTNGWTGVNCTEDIDECNDTTNAICPTNSECENLNGTYRCICNDGFSMAEGQCVSCSSSTFGRNCGKQCTCEFRNTLSCDKMNGTCYCYEGWEGIHCSEDVKECTHYPSICGNNAICQETNGSYTCLCNDGYEKTLEGLCENTNECVLGTNNHNCSENAECMDTMGSFNCTCKPGFKGDGFNCIACNNATFGVQCSEVCNCLMENTFDCNDITGKCACKGNWNGSRCEIHVEDCINGSAVCDLRKEKCAKENGTDNHFCVCLYGKTPTNKTCLAPVPPHIPTDEEARYEGTATLNINVSQNEFEDLTSNITDDIENQLSEHFRDSIGTDKFLNLTVLSIRLGSLIIHYEVIVKKTGVLEKLTKVYVIATYNLTQQVLLIEPLQRQASVEKIFITIEGQNATISTFDSLCNIFQKYGLCLQNEQCQEVSGSPVCVAIKDTGHLKETPFFGT